MKTVQPSPRLRFTIREILLSTAFVAGIAGAWRLGLARALAPIGLVCGAILIYYAIILRREDGDHFYSYLGIGIVSVFAGVLALVCWL